MTNKNLGVFFIVVVSFTMAVVFYNINEKGDTSHSSIERADLRKIVFALVSSAENSSVNYSKQYSYIEDIGDGRGYTAGIIGFTSGTGDLLEVIKKYAELKTSNNILVKYIPALEKINGSDSLDGLGNVFVEDWKTAAKDVEMVQAQTIILDEMYLCPAVQFANQDGLSPLGQYVYYDAFVVHGPGNDEDSFNGIRIAAQRLTNPPAQGGSERTYLVSFLEARTKIMLKEEAHSDLSRIETQRKFINEKNYTLKLPLEWMMYGDKFELTPKQWDSLE